METSQKRDFSVYLVTDRSRFQTNQESFFQIIQQALEGGISVLQLREKEASTREFLEIALRVQGLCKSAKVPLLINDRIDVALAIDADGVHVGKDDMPIKIVRQLIGPNKIIGATVRTVQDASAAIAEGADYLGTEAVFGSQVKSYEEGPMGVDNLRDLIQAVRSSKHPVPVIAIGGISEANADHVLKDANPDGIAFVSAVMNAENPKSAVQNLKAIVGRYRQEVASLSLAFDQQFPALISSLLDQIRNQKPLVHHITNYVVMNDTANVTIHLGASSPVMAHAIEEVAEMVSHAKALVLNPGTLSRDWVEAMKVAGKEANRLGVPIVLDPVGAGATKYRTDTILDFLNTFKVSVLKGNPGEISALAGVVGKVRGVESVGEVSHPGDLTKSVAQRYGCTVVMTGSVDWVSDGVEIFTVHNGTPQLSGLTGTGCTVAAAIGAFAAVSRENMLVASVAGLCCIEIAAEVAVESCGSKGPASFKVAWHDCIANLTTKDLQKAKVKNQVK